MVDPPDELKDSRQFLEAFLRQGPEGRELSERMAAGHLVLLLSALLTVSVRESWPQGPSIDELASYAQGVRTRRDDYPRRMVLEGALRAGAGDQRILDGLPEDEVLLAVALVIRRLVHDLEARSIVPAELIERAVELARAQPGPDQGAS